MKDFIEIQYQQVDRALLQEMGRRVLGEAYYDLIYKTQYDLLDKQFEKQKNIEKAVLDEKYLAAIKENNND